jgi:hypothetical protein
MMMKQVLLVLSLLTIAVLAIEVGKKAAILDQELGQQTKCLGIARLLLRLVFVAHLVCCFVNHFICVINSFFFALFRFRFRFLSFFQLSLNRNLLQQVWHVFT